MDAPARVVLDFPQKSWIISDMAEMIPVKSSNLAGIAYEPNQMILTVWFLNGSIYNYYDVPTSVWTSFQNADSKGKYLAANIKGRFGYERVS